MFDKKYWISKLIVFCCIIIVIDCTLSPPRNKKDKTAKQKDHKSKSGPVGTSVFDRNLIQEEPLASQIAIENQAYYKDTSFRQFNSGAVLGYVTPWNCEYFAEIENWVTAEIFIDFGKTDYVK
jgi:chitinase domain-containing protein 1